jgi:hypothetical protein
MSAGALEMSVGALGHKMSVEALDLENDSIIPQRKNKIQDQICWESISSLKLILNTIIDW